MYKFNASLRSHDCKTAYPGGYTFSSVIKWMIRAGTGKLTATLVNTKKGRKKTACCSFYWGAIYEPHFWLNGRSGRKHSPSPGKMYNWSKLLRNVPSVKPVVSDLLKSARLLQCVNLHPSVRTGCQGHRGCIADYVCGRQRGVMLEALPSKCD